MSSQKIRNALGLLQDDEDNEAAWLELQDALTSPDVGLSDEELIDLLGAARREHETRREWSAVANLLEYEIAQCQGSSKEVARLAELARVLEDELLDDKRAVDVYKRWLDLRPDDPTATEAMARVEDQRVARDHLPAFHIGILEPEARLDHQVLTNRFGTLQVSGIDVFPVVKSIGTADVFLPVANRLFPTADATLGLGDIAARQGDTQTAIRYYEPVAKSNSSLAPAARERIAKLRGYSR